ncbi:GNAT family N-acetyltransferase [Tenacibaculum singaporense]|uniref:N-acetyltransferase n=1 Tax=Tenacibaculum singaporense TaxID=2358479 RepID=A0A3Q8RKZ3_9FLAO|nr:GNAT family N-acetyltransferase [Tenacibaculum singaporense]AZJ34339.1 N-acetyltransferase [Tenacibaculum singaporense]
MVQTYQTVFSKKITGLGIISIRPFQLETDTLMLHSWVTKPYAKYWGMLEKSLEEVRAEYQEIEKSPHHYSYIGMLNDAPVFLMEQYKASEDIIANYYDVQEKDYGMHVLVAPVEKRIPQFTWHVFSTIIDYFFSVPQIERIVVEPDVNNEKIHTLNRKAGFVYQKEIELPHKKAALAFCTKTMYQSALTKLEQHDK